MVTLYYTYDSTDKIKGAFDYEGLVVNINKRIIETWYVYLTLTKLVNGSIRVKNYSNGIIQLIKKGEFIYLKNDTYELTIINFHLDYPEDANAAIYQY